jgi:hypothetical protein
MSSAVKFLADHPLFNTPLAFTHYHPSAALEKYQRVNDT